MMLGAHGQSLIVSSHGLFTFPLSVKLELASYLYQTEGKGEQLKGKLQLVALLPVQIS